MGKEYFCWTVEKFRKEEEGEEEEDIKILILWESDNMGNVYKEDNVENKERKSGMKIY